MDVTRAFRNLRILLLSLGSLTSAAASGATIEVPRDFLSIQQAMDAAAPGDTVLVGPGTYLEYIDFKGKSISVKSASGPEKTVIDAGSLWCAVSFVQGEGPAAVLEGFTVRNGLGGGYPKYVGGGITCKYSSPTLRNNHILNNRAGDGSNPWGDGGGIYCDSASPSITENVIQGNQALYNCGGIFCKNGSSPEIRRNTLQWNVGYVSGAIYCQYGSSPVIEENVIRENTATNGCEGWGAGIFCYGDSHPVIRNNAKRAFVNQ